MERERIAELLEPFFDPADDQKLRGDDLGRISTYIDLLLRWNARVNLTGVREPGEIVTRHFGESLFAARQLFPRHLSVSSAAANPLQVADLGSGAGFPGMPIKLWAPNIFLTLIESNHKKATFLREVVRALTLTNVDIQNMRAESLPQSSFDLVTVRAVERFTDVLPIAAKLLAPSGRLGLLIASSQAAAVRSTLPRLSWGNPLPIPGSHSRILLASLSAVGGIQ